MLASTKELKKRAKIKEIRRLTDILNKRMVRLESSKYYPDDQVSYVYTNLINKVKTITNYDYDERRIKTGKLNELDYDDVNRLLNIMQDAYDNPRGTLTRVRGIQQKQLATLRESGYDLSEDAHIRMGRIFETLRASMQEQYLDSEQVVSIADETDWDDSQLTRILGYVGRWLDANPNAYTSHVLKLIEDYKWMLSHPGTARDGTPRDMQAAFVSTYGLDL